MSARFVLFIAGLAVLLCGCDTYRYGFETTINEDGSVERTITFVKVEQEDAEQVAVSVKVEGQSDEQPVTVTIVEEDDAQSIGGDAPSADAPADDGEDAEPRSALPDNFVLPDESRFIKFEQLDNGITGTWRSDGLIDADFRAVVPAHVTRGTRLTEPPPLLQQPQCRREAYNEGVVVVTDLILVKAITYIEQFHDYYTRAEFEAHGDILLEALADLGLGILHEDLDDEYDLSEFDLFVRGTLLPIAKRAKCYLYSECFIGHGLWRRSSPVEKTLWPGKLALAYDLIKVGAIQDPFFDLEDDADALAEWVMTTMHATVRHKGTGELWPTEEVERYFTECDGTGATAAERAAARFIEQRSQASEEKAPDLGDYLSGFYTSFAESWSEHQFELTTHLPGVVVHAVPEPDTVEEAGGRSTVRWSFDAGALFPDGVLLSCVAVVPCAKEQEALFGSAVLQTREEIEDYLVLLRDFSKDERGEILVKLGECVEQQRLAPFKDYARDLLPEGWSPEADEQPPLGSLLLFLEGLAAK